MWKFPQDDKKYAPQKITEDDKEEKTEEMRQAKRIWDDRVFADEWEEKWG